MSEQDIEIEEIRFKGVTISSVAMTTTTTTTEAIPDPPTTTSS